MIEAIAVVVGVGLLALTINLGKLALAGRNPQPPRPDVVSARFVGQAPEPTTDARELAERLHSAAQVQGQKLAIARHVDSMIEASAKSFTPAWIQPTPAPSAPSDPPKA